MNFFKKLFSSKKETHPSEKNEEGTPFNTIYSTEYFDKRYTEDHIENGMLDGCLKMVESYFIDNKIERKIAHPMNHPTNLDQVDQDGLGFVLYCKAFQLGEKEATLFLAYAFSDFLITRYGFKLFKDATPEYPLRGMTLKYDRNGLVLSLYPYEYASKVLTGNQTFSEMNERLDAQLAKMPNMDDLLSTNKNSKNNP
ncbi:hypothetical protein ACFO3O_00085 [Dokdonia ponticola]|uniref:Uncharacterized protein n=1 Tax=Dokdonia ponticola TaxID=2041041 RepID=A0ABV9HTI3_9FLAO